MPFIEAIQTGIAAMTRGAKSDLMRCHGSIWLQTEVAGHQPCHIGQGGSGGALAGQGTDVAHVVACLCQIGGGAGYWLYWPCATPRGGSGSLL